MSEPVVDHATGQHRQRLSAAVAGWLGCTEGQAQTAVLGLVLGLVLAAIGVPPALRDRPAATRAADALVPLPRAAPQVAPQAPSPPASSVPLAPVSQSSPSGAVPPTVPEAVAVEAFPDLPLDLPPDAAPSPPPSPVTVFAEVPPPGAPSALAVDAGGSVYAVTDNARGRGSDGPGKLLRFAPDGTFEHAYDVAGQVVSAPLRLTGVALEADGRVLVLDGSTARVVRLRPDGTNQETVATLVDLPACGPVTAAPLCEPGSDDPPRASGIAVARDGTIFVSDRGQATIWRIPAGGRQAAPWYGSPELDGEPGLGGLAVDQAGSVYAVAGDVWRVKAGRAGEAREPARVAELDHTERPAGLALAPDGSMIVTLADADAVVVLAPNGVAQSRVSGAAGGIGLDSPVGVAVRGATVLVANRSKSGDGRWRIMEVAL